MSKDDEDTEIGDLAWGSESVDGRLHVWFGRQYANATKVVIFAFIETGAELELEVEDRREQIVDYADRPMLSALVSTFTAERHGGLDLSIADRHVRISSHKWDVLALRDAACRAWEEMISIEESRGQNPHDTLLGRALFNLALGWANAYGPRGTGSTN